MADYTSAYTGAQIDSGIGKANSAVQSALSVNAQTGAAYTLVLSDARKKVTMGSVSANAVTVPDNATVAFPTGTVLSVTQIGTGVTSIKGASGVTINGAVAKTGPLSARWGSVTLTKTAVNTWLADGSIGAFV